MIRSAAGEVIRFERAASRSQLYLAALCRTILDRGDDTRKSEPGPGPGGRQSAAGGSRYSSWIGLPVLYWLSVWCSIMDRFLGEGGEGWGIMKVICPKCQYENNQQSTTRLVCGRCATIIEVRVDPGYDGQARRQTSKLPYANGGAPGGSPIGGETGAGGRGAADSGYPGQTTGRPGDSVPGVVQVPPPGRIETERGDQFDDVLDQVEAPTGNWAGGRAGGWAGGDVLDDNYATSGPPGEGGRRSPGDAAESWSAARGSFQFSGGPQRETRDCIESEDPDLIDWPVLSQGSDLPDEDPPFTATRGGLVLRIVLGVAVFAGLIGGAYLFLGDLIARRQVQSESLQGADRSRSAEAGAGGAATATSALPAAAPSVAPAAPVATPTLVAEAAPPSRSEGVPGRAEDSRPVDIPPMTGRAGHSEPPKPLAPPATVSPASGQAGSQAGSAAGARREAPVEIPTGGGWTLQVGSYADEKQARERIVKLKAVGVEARLVRAEISGRGTWHRVQVGGFGTRDEGLKYGGQLRSRGVITDFIVTATGR